MSTLRAHKYGLGLLAQFRVTWLVVKPKEEAEEQMVLG